jgi:signal peptidase I
VNGDGEPVSYRYIVFALLGLWLAYSLLKKKKEKE